MYPPNYRSGDDDDCCPCTFGHPCESHARAQEEATERYRNDSISRGINPDADITGLEELLFMVEFNDYLSKHQKDSIMRILFPLGKP